MRLLTTYIKELSINQYDLVYENLIADMKSESSKLLEYLQLEWHPNIEKFHENRSIVNTPSYQQVNKPIYQDSKFRFKNYFKKIKKDSKPLNKWIEYFNYQK